MDADQYLKERIEEQVKWLSGKSAWNQRWFKLLRAVEIVLGCLIAFLVAYADSSPAVKFMVGGFGVGVAVLGGILSVYRFQENWIEFRMTAESLKRERFLFLTGAPPYAGDDRFAVLVTRAEAILGSESAQWAAGTASVAARGEPPAGGGP